MSDWDDDNGNDADRLAARRAEKLSRAIEAARVRRAQAGGGQPAQPRKPKLPPPPPVDPADLRALGLPVPPQPAPDPAVSQPAEPDGDPTPADPLILGTGATRAVSSDELIFDPPHAQTSEPEHLEDTPAMTRPLFGGATVASDTTAAADPVPAVGESAPEQAPGPATLLRLENVYTDIGRYRILQGVDLEVPEGQVTMLLGRNGVGKTTTLRTIMGLWRAREGKIWFNGRGLGHLPPAAIARQGIGYVPEDMGIFGDLTVEENMRLGAVSGRMNRVRVDWLTGAFPALKTFWTKPAATLSGGQKQMLSIARIMVEPRKLYLIDEPTKGLAPAIVSTLAGALRDLKHEGATILMVEQNFSVAKALGDTCAVMDDGKVTWSGRMDTLAGDPGLQAELMGLHLEAGH